MLSSSDNYGEDGIALGRLKTRCFCISQQWSVPQPWLRNYCQVTMFESYSSGLSLELALWAAYSTGFDSFDVFDGPWTSALL